MVAVPTLEKYTGCLVQCIESRVIKNNTHPYSRVFFAHSCDILVTASSRIGLQILQMMACSEVYRQCHVVEPMNNKNPGKTNNEHAWLHWVQMAAYMWEWHFTSTEHIYVLGIIITSVVVYCMCASIVCISVWKSRLNHHVVCLSTGRRWHRGVSVQCNVHSRHLQPCEEPHASEDAELCTGQVSCIWHWHDELPVRYRG